MTIKKTSLREAASGLALASCILMSLAIIPMCWMIPMTVVIRRRIKNNQPMGLALPICYLIFGGLLSMIASILLFIDFSRQEDKAGK